MCVYVRPCVCVSQVCRFCYVLCADCLSLCVRGTPSHPYATIHKQHTSHKLYVTPIKTSSTLHISHHTYTTKTHNTTPQHSTNTTQHHTTTHTTQHTTHTQHNVTYRCTTWSVCVHGCNNTRSHLRTLTRNLQFVLIVVSCSHNSIYGASWSVACSGIQIEKTHYTLDPHPKTI